MRHAETCHAKAQGRGTCMDLYSKLALIPRLLGCVLFLSFIPTFATASPFINLNPDPELASLQPVTSTQATATQAKAQAEPANESLPALVLNFVPETTGDAKLHFTDVWERMRAGFAMPPLNTKEVAQSEAWYAARPELVTNIFQRSRYYLFHIVEEIEKRNMPMELALLPFIESGYDPFALSSAQASGLWQFIPATGNRYKLQQNDNFDARRDIIASTTAALDYLEALHAQFGDWHLALAAYNWGENQVERALERNRVRGLGADFASLSLPSETRSYVPKLMAVKQIVMSPESFRVALPTTPNLRYFSTVARSTIVDLAQAARLADMKLEEFKALNPAHNNGAMTVSASTPLLVPTDRAQSFGERLDAYLLQEEQRRKTQPGKSSGHAGQTKRKPCC